MQYELFIPPFRNKEFREFSKKQAEEYFQWYVGQISLRMQILGNYIKEEGEKFVLDYSPESLISLWEWFEKKIIMVEKTQEEYQRELTQNPEWMREWISPTKISMETFKFQFDIAIYFAEVVRKNSGGKLYWGYITKPKNSATVNRPVLLGFKFDMELDPMAIIKTCTLRSSKEHNKTRLFDLYKVWMDKYSVTG